MLDFQLFRIKVYSAGQKNLFEKDKSRSEVLDEVINSLPSAELRTNIIWHIGNIAKIDATGLYFRIGRTSPSTLELFKDGNFMEQNFETAPYTHVLLDTKLEVCAIANRTKVSPTVSGIANQFIQLLNKSGKASHFVVKFEADKINDPDDFIGHIQKAYAISKFWITFKKPNPFDANEDFVKPYQKLLQEIHGEKGKSELMGDQLKPDVVENLARSAASTGDDASALIQVSQKGKKTRKYLKGNPVIIQHDDISDNDQKKTFLERIREVYFRIRGKEDETNEL
ncbi:MAG: hypothetical protein A2298_04430 [Gammaproteobacteria bacterium RIFOXYB2_FULL_38_6]|nr:MAG: hypothetical protein A2298_04430 [Gammaproteobacteria bacterium RIFOXYB2_FULL_38_6]